MLHARRISSAHATRPALIATFLLALMFLAPRASAGAPTPLFASSEPIEISIAGPIAQIAKKAATSTDPHPAKFSQGGETFAIELSARGHARRRPETCKFPPLRVKFQTAPPAGSLFHKQKTLKLVTHCRPQESYQQKTLLEYAAYRMYNELTDESFRVRLAKVRYVDSASGDTFAERLGFFIEDTDDLAARAGLADVKAEKIVLSQHDPEAAARSVLFFHMIANHDWSMLAGPESECCHNGKLLGSTKTATSGLVYVPYDFDYSGLVDAPYAVPPDTIPIKTVKTRFYRGSCSQNAEIPAMAAHFRERRAAMIGALRATPFLSAKTANGAAKYVDGFFKEIADDAGVGKLLKRCR